MYTEIFAGYSTSEKLLNGLLVGLSGMIMVFFILTLLMVLIMLMSRIINGSTKRKDTKAVAGSAEKKREEAQTIIPQADQQAKQADTDNTLIAVITAAVSAYRTAEGNTGGFRVVSFRKNKKKR